jgi:hypothetical protein
MEPKLESGFRCVVPLRDGRRLAYRGYSARGDAPVSFHARSPPNACSTSAAGPKWSEAATSRLSKHLTRSPPT